MEFGASRVIQRSHKKYIKSEAVHEAMRTKIQILRQKGDEKDEWVLCNVLNYSRNEANF